MTADNYFSSILLAKGSSSEISYIRRNLEKITEIPECFLPCKEKPPKSSIFGFQNKCMIVSYVPEKNKAVCMVSTMHYNAAIDPETRDEKKPYMITTYHEKAAEDVVFWREFE